MPSLNVLLCVYLCFVVIFECFAFASRKEKEDGFTRPLDNWYSVQIRILIWPVVFGLAAIAFICYSVMCLIFRFDEWMSEEKKIYLWPPYWY